jgi:hypothetical protein
MHGYGPFIKVQITPAKPIFSSEAGQGSDTGQPLAFGPIGCGHPPPCCVHVVQARVLRFLGWQAEITLTTDVTWGWGQLQVM